MINRFRPFLRLRLGSVAVSLSVATNLSFVARKLRVSKYSIKLAQQSSVVMSQKSIAFFFSNSPVEKKEISVKHSPTKAKARKRLIVESDDSTDEPTNKENRVEAAKVHCSLNDTSEATDIPDSESSSPFLAKHKLKTELASTQDVSSTLASDSGSLRKVQINDKISAVSSLKTKIVRGSDNVNTSGLSQESVKKYGVITQISSFSYDPSKPNYHPINDAPWSKSSSVPYLALAKTFEYIESTSGRLKITEALSNLFRSVGFLSPNDLSICIHLCLNQVGPAYQGNELGVGDTILLKALGMTTGVGLEHLKSSLKRQGDLGTLAESIRSRQKTMFTPKPLTVSVVFNKIKEIAVMSGNAAQTKKVERICSLLVACRECEAKYLIRSLSGKLRIGLAEQTVLSALGQAVALTPFHSLAAVEDAASSSRLLDASIGLSNEQWKNRLETCVSNVKKAYCVCPNYDTLVAGLLADGPDGLYQHCFISPGVPVKPMLAHPTRGVTDVLKRFDEADFTCEYKYDGERAQIHVVNPRVTHVYSRNQEDTTSKYPDIVNTVMPRVLDSTNLTKTACKHLGVETMAQDGCVTKVQSCILDSEVVAWDRQACQILPFQILSTRKRKDVDETAVKVQVCVYAFDLLYLNGVSLIEKPLRVRREILREVFPQVQGEFMMATSLDSSDTDAIASFLDESIKGNCEGLMVKTLDRNSTYEIAKRSHNWLKLKKDYLDNVGDTLDLVVIGGFHGSGKRTGRYGGFLLACYDTNSEEYQTICKIGTGMKDEDLANFSSFFKDHVIETAKPYYQYTPGLIPDHWFEPVQVWEIKAADLSISPAHKAAAGLADPEKGISLRFPRFLRIREDKKPEDATSAQQVYEFYKSQQQIKNQENNGPTNADDEDLY
ncbi:hypothetical protein EG68_08626 [Paragonimus skrjabini miyazakii]|uniref:DNA ligase n=1 Tax=Paragonimus skrjabini miyazakii TaxID=59628 RepID=A0A8S9Y8F4_9TREM|nr:hypothetical protein EG68_08626 [Paragonimus skrjabini miyazakii]